MQGATGTEFVLRCQIGLPVELEGVFRLALCMPVIRTLLKYEDASVQVNEPMSILVLLGRAALGLSTAQSIDGDLVQPILNRTGGLSEEFERSRCSLSLGRPPQLLNERNHARDTRFYT